MHLVSAGSRWHSPKTQATLVTLIAFLICIWSLTGYFNHVFHNEILRVMGEQQSSTASFIAGDIGVEFRERMNALEQFASEIDAPKRLCRGCHQQDGKNTKKSNQHK